MQGATLNRLPVQKTTTTQLTHVPPSCATKIEATKQMSMKRLRSVRHPSSYHCPASKRLDCNGWPSDWPRALAGRAGHCEGRLGNELEIQQNRDRLFRETGERQTRVRELGRNEGPAGNGEEKQSRGFWKQTGYLLGRLRTTLFPRQYDTQTFFTSTTDTMTENTSSSTTTKMDFTTPHHHKYHTVAS